MVIGLYSEQSDLSETALEELVEYLEVFENMGQTKK